ncbi:MAG: hypothetical protein SFU83_15560 [Meiothermus sp.]|nr:hypothetical protein [Meiothermus sp.]
MRGPSRVFSKLFLAAGLSFFVWGAGSTVLAQVGKAGNPDPDWNGGSGVITSNPTYKYMSAWGGALQPDGKLVVVGSANNSLSPVWPYGVFALARFTRTGQLDPTFGQGGFVHTSFGDAVDTAGALVIHPDGKITALGCVTVRGPAFALAQYQPDGSLNPDFGQGGQVITDVSCGNAEFIDIGIQADGKIVFAGTMVNQRGQPIEIRYAVVRVNPDGSLDRSFGNEGVVIDVFRDNSRGVTMAIQTDGKIVVGGVNLSRDFKTSSAALARYLPDGRTDPTFGQEGKVTTEDAGIRTSLGKLQLQPDGKILFVGYNRSNNSQEIPGGVARFETDGRLDATFGSGGFARVAIPGRQTFIPTDVTTQHDGKILVSGLSLRQGMIGMVPKVIWDTLVVARLNPDGSADLSFGTQGVVTRTNNDHSDYIATDVVVDGEGRITVTGWYREYRVVHGPLTVANSVHVLTERFLGR